MLSRLTGQTIALIVVGVTILVALLWYFTMYQNTLAEQETLRTEIAELDQKIEVGNRAKANVATLCTTVVELRAQRREFLRALPSSEKFADILRILKTQVGNNGGRINSLNRTNSGAGAQLPAGIRSINTNIATEGPFSALTGTLQSLEGQQRFLRLDNINVAVITNNQDEAPKPTGPDLNSQISVIAYVYDGARGNEEPPLDQICTQFLPQTQPDQPTTPTSEVPR
jgi:Tfp pilus assembly protein PilO